MSTRMQPASRSAVKSAASCCTQAFRPLLPHRRSCYGSGRAGDGASRCAAKRAATAAPTSRPEQVQHVASSPAPMQPPLVSQHTVSTAVMLLTVYHVAIFGLMVLGRSLQPMRSFMLSLWPFLPLALGYGLLLANSWSPDTLSIMMPGSLEEGLKGGFNPQFLPKLEGISALFQRPMTAASWLIHIWAINLFLGRTIYVEGMEQGIPTWHSLVLSCFLGPLGLVSHSLTKVFCKPSPQPVVIREQESGGSITLLPYADA